MIELDKQDIHDIFERHCENIKQASSNKDQFYSCCPFHDDENPSFSFNIEKGKFKCQYPGCPAHEGGNIASFLMLEYGIKKEDVPKKLMQMGYRERTVDNEPIDPSIVEKYHSLLLKNDEAINFLKDYRGINKNSIRKFKLGFDGERLLIPIKDIDGTYVNIRRYASNANAKYLPWDSGYSASLFPIKNLVKSDWILLLEGELDAILGDQVGYPSLSTFGAGTWSSDWNSLFSGKIVYICYDNDEAGQTGAKNVAEQIYDYADKVHKIELPVEEKGADFTDYIHNMGHDKSDFDNLIEQTDPYIIKDKEKDEEDTNEPYEVPLATASHKDFYQKEISTECMVTGKAISPSIIPKKVRISCNVHRGKTCNGCPLKEKQGLGEYELTEPETKIDMINCTTNAQINVIKEAIGISGCNQFEIDEIENSNVEEIRVIPEVDISDYATKDNDYVVRDCYHIGHGMETNKSYRMKGKTIAHPRSQKVTHVFEETKSIQDDVDNFILTDEKIEGMKKFQPEGDDVEGKLAEIYEDFVANVTHIYQRDDLLCSVDLVYHSPLSFNFNGDFVRKGWLDLLVLGDTRTGKTATVESISAHYGAGELCIGENSTYAGLVGGVEKIGDEWMLTWGKIPRNDKKMLTVDEISSLTTDEIGRMTGMRSSGVAEIVKIRTERTSARTRMVWMSNPRSNRTLSDFTYGVLAIPELIGKPEDVSKFDFVVTCSSDEINPEVYNKFNHEELEHKYTSNICHDLVMWAWSRRPQDIEFTDEAIKQILNSAEWFGKKYSAAIPIVEAANQRIKLARLSASVAARLFSTDEEYEKVIVKKEHAKFASKFLNSLLSKPSLGYDLFSDNRNKDNHLQNEEKIKDVIQNGNLPDSESFIDNVLDNKSFTKTDFQIFTGLDKGTSQQFLSFLMQNRAIKKYGNKYAPTSAFAEALRDLKRHKYTGGKKVSFLQ